jgi:uncharacterized protein
MADVLRSRLKESPAVALTGPRQCGKTTLARSLSGAYFDLEKDADCLRLDLEWDALVSSKRLVVFDEAHAYPPLFKRLRSAIDEDRRRNGRFLLLGSVSPELMTHVSESLAGRLALLELTPFLVAELPRANLNDFWRRGGYPDGGVLSPASFPRWQRDYIDLLSRRDLPNWGLPARPRVTDRLLRMLAAVHGRIWNASQLAQSLGITYPTVNSYLDFLEGAFLIRRLEPWHANLKKRLVKSPKIYWRDAGLLHSLLGVESGDDLLSRPWVGASWEGFVIEQICGRLNAEGRGFRPFFFRTSDGHEIDLLIEIGGKLWAIEIKLSSSPGADDFQRLSKASDLVGADKRILVSMTRRLADSRHALSCSLPWLLAHIDEI